MQEEKPTLEAPPNNKSRKQLVKKGANDFELEDNDNWPDVDVGNLIIDLDADIDKEAMASVPLTTSPPADAPTAATQPPAVSATPPTLSSAVSPLVPAAASKMKTLVTTHCNSGSGSATQTLTETLTRTTAASPPAASPSQPAAASGSNSDKEKGLKMKIKRTKQGPRHPEGKLEIVPNKPSGSAGGGSPREGSPVPNGSSLFMPCGDPTLMSAADIVAAAKAAAVKHGGPKAVGGNKVRLSNSSGSDSNGSNNVISKKAASKQPQNGGDHGKVSSNNKVNSKSKVDGSCPASGAASGGPPAAKRQKVDASVGTEIGTMTEPECLGPLDPGTSVTLEGIVWNETDGVLVINVTWRGKTYVGTLLDSTRHVNQWAPPRYSESPTSELDSRTPKGRGTKRGRGSAGTPVETETRKNLRSSKSKSSRGSGSAGLNSPAKRKGRGSDGDEKSGDENKRKRTDSSRNSPGDDDDDSEKEAKGNESDKDSATSSVKGKDDKDDLFMLPKDKEEEKYIPPPPLPYALVCPKSDCKKRYRQHNGLRFHVSHAHPELLDEVGNIRDTSEIERLEREAKERLPKDNHDQGSTDSHSGSSSKTSTPGPNEVSNSNSGSTDSMTVPISVPLPPSSGLKVPGPPLDAKPIPVSAIEGGIPANARPPAPVLQSIPLHASSRPPHAHVKPIRPPVNARPIVPATGPQIMHGGGLGPSAINLKPIQPRPTIMPDPTPNLALDDLKKSKKHKKSTGSPGTSPPRALQHGLNGSSPKIQNHQQHHSVPTMEATVPPSAKSPAYSDISDDEGDRKRNATQSSINLPFGLPPSASLPTVPVSPQQAAAAAKEKKELVTGPQPGTIEYEKMLLAYGFPPFPYPIPPGMDPGMHLHMLATDPVYKNKYEKDRADKEKAFKEQIDRDNREKDRKAGVKLPPSEEATASSNNELHHKKNMISVKPEFRDNHHAPKKEPQRQQEYHQPKKVEDEGMKATMETRGPPPATPTSYAGLMHPALMGRPPFYDPGLLAAGIPPHLLASLYGSNPYLHPGFAAPGAMRPPFMPGAGGSPEDLSRSAALAMAAVTSLAGGNSATKALDLLQQHANQYYAAAVAASAAATMTSSSSPSSHKIHELQERALKSPGMGGRGGSGTSSPNVTARSTPSSSSFNTVTTTSTTTKTSDFASCRKGTPSPRTTTPTGGSRSRSPPPLRHVHTHTHTHFGLGYPLLPPSGVPGVAPPAAHTPFPPAGFPSHLLPGKPPIPGALPSFPPPK